MDKKLFKNYLKLVLVIIFCFSQNISGQIKNNANQMPQWFKEHLEFMTNGSGLWIADNSKYKSENEPFEAYGTERMSPQVSANKSQSKKVDKIIEAYYKAIGGYKKLKNIKTLVRKGTYIEPAYNLILTTAKTESKRPNFRLVGNPDEGFAEGFDGASWEYFKDKGVIRSTGEAEAATRRGAEFDESFVDYKQKGHVVILEGIINLGINKVYVLKVILKDDWVKHYYLDFKTNLIIALRKAMPVHAKGEAVETITFISEYKPINGVLFPFVFIERKTSDGSLLNALLLDSIEANVEIDNNRFSPPKIQK